MVRAKFVLSEITELMWGGKRLKFMASYDTMNPEDITFQKATPTGTFEMVCDNPAANEQMHLGKAYYFDISEAS